MREAITAEQILDAWKTIVELSNGNMRRHAAVRLNAAKFIVEVAHGTPVPQSFLEDIEALKKKFEALEARQGNGRKSIQAA